MNLVVSLPGEERGPQGDGRQQEGTEQQEGRCGGEDSLGPAGPPPGRERLKHPQGVHPAAHA